MIQHPQAVTSQPFVGRERALDELAALFAAPHVRLVTVIGPGGVGKTTLARTYTDARGASVPFVELGEIDDARLVGPLVEAALARRSGDVDLVVLDNLEHLGAQGGRAVAELVARYTARFLVTSRAPLDLGDEYLLRLDPLALPVSHRADDVLASPAVQALLGHAERRGVRPTGDAAALASIAKLCARLDGLPLALALAAACLRSHSPDSLVTMLENHAALPARAMEDAPARQGSLERAVEWSYGLLTPGDALWLRHLALLRAPFDEEIAAALGAACVLPEADGVLARLADASLLEVEMGGPRFRFRLLDTIRRFALAELARFDEDAYGRERHADLFARLTPEQALRASAPDGGDAMSFFARHREDIRTARATLMERADLTDAARLTLAAARFLHLDIGNEEFCRWLEELEPHPLRLSPDERVMLALRTAQALHAAVRLDEARVRYEGILRDLDRTASPIVWMQTSGGLVETLRELGAHTEALRLAEERTAFARTRPEPRFRIWAGIVASALAFELARYDDGVAHAREAERASREENDPYNLANSLGALGANLAWTRGGEDAVRAEAHVREAITLLDGLDLPGRSTVMRQVLVGPLLAQGRDVDALAETAHAARELGAHPGVFNDLLGLMLADVALATVRMGRERDAARALRAVERWSEGPPKPALLPRLIERLDLVRELLSVAGDGALDDPGPADDPALVLDELIGTHGGGRGQEAVG